MKFDNLIEVKNMNYGDINTENMLINGDNIIVLKELEKHFKEKIKCIYIDPPYNTGNIFKYYKDKLDHLDWLNSMKPRLKIMKNLLFSDGSICIQINSIELANLKILMDEIFGNDNFINIITIKTKITGVNFGDISKKRLKNNIEFILLYAKDFKKFNLYKIPQKKEELFSVIKSHELNNKNWMYKNILKEIDDGDYIKSYKSGNGDEIKLYKHENYKICSVSEVSKKEFNNNLKDTYYNYVNKIFRTTNAQTTILSKFIEETKEYNNKGIFSIEYIPIKGKNIGKNIRIYFKNNNIII